MDGNFMDKAAAYKIEFEDRGKYLYVLVGGEKLTPEIAKLYWDEIAQMCFSQEKSKIMIEKDFSQSVSPAEILDMGVYLGKILRDKKIAFMDRHKNENINELGKIIARNQKVIMKIFHNAKEAENWLIGI